MDFEGNFKKYNKELKIMNNKGTKTEFLASVIFLMLNIMGYFFLYQVIEKLHEKIRRKEDKINTTYIDPKKSCHKGVIT
ncbi:hypothetical protein [Carnobacterium maltaromaticum]|uniref:hypothetical protein n=1 Tax=Carnobacterium maltaromaticum TaxID=2751 RepID=UPI0007050F36|nr:hypothetical protein [Carnobacterium maltaromaticum]AOA04032.1 hypothetical protein BFC23_16930 [Carnobacterium maltaromaticum]KRN88128.1 hypothetical protein IV75_GL002013 [Carnobacterium maltaromaticum]MBC9810548.1 hypothetical protein [Carnobacterium maltaromaticum]